MLSRFHSLSSLLTEHQRIWKTPVFQIRDFSYLAEYETTVQALLSLSDAEVERLQSDDLALLARLEQVFPDAQKVSECIHFPMIELKRKTAPPKFWNIDIPGRKEEQILAFTEALGDIKDPLVEWCCGKQHLGRLLAELHQQHTIGLDIDVGLITQARQLAEKRQLQQWLSSECCDVLSEQAEIHVDASKHLIALHACGGLHTRLVQTAVKKRAARISYSPCCYHRFLNSVTYQPMSETGRQSGLCFSQEELRLAVRETQTASKGESRKRKNLQIWRLGFDELQSDLLNTDQYLPIPPVSPKILQSGFESFCKYVASLKSVSLKAGINYSDYLEQGRQRFHRYQCIELFRMVFRRALECWLVLDTALFLEEQGYRCEIAQFCMPEISPRNLLVQARIA